MNINVWKLAYREGNIGYVLCPHQLQLDLSAICEMEDPPAQSSIHVARSDIEFSVHVLHRLNAPDPTTETLCKI